MRRIPPTLLECVGPMISAACPSCGAPVRFAHAVAVATVCERCRSTVVRSGSDLSLAGKSSVFPRDLSPIMLGVTGSFEGRSFVVAGVLRKARARVRWSEWFCVFDDGRLGWLGEGNGELSMFDRSFDAEGAPDQSQCVPGNRIRVGKQVWQVLESATAAVVGAEGELPLVAADGLATPYVDLRKGDGKTTATLDHAFTPPLLYTGRIVALKELNLDRLRPVSGWSDPELHAAFSGPELTGTRALTCPFCTASVEWRNPESTNLVCRFCGSVIDLATEVPEVVRAVEGVADWTPSIPLGARGKLDDTEWEVIGVMERSVWADGRKWPWIEYFLFNPFHGYRWLTEDGATRQWSLIRRLPDLPELAATGYAMEHDGDVYRHFQGGTAVVGRVMGEFTWEIQQGDEAKTNDFIDPPWILSVEDERNERTAAVGRWVSTEEVLAGFADAKPFRPSGIAPNQPNPYDATGTIVSYTIGTALFALAALMLFALQTAVSADTTLLTADHTASGVSGERFATQGFSIPEAMRRTVTVNVDSAIDPDHGLVHVTLINTTDGTAVVARPGRTNGTDRIWNPTAGSYMAVVEVATDSAAHLQGKTVRIEVVHDRPYWLPVAVAFLIALLGPLMWFGGRAFFETQRWSNSDHG